MSLTKDQKVQQTSEIKDKISKSQSVVIAKYQGLKVKEIQSLKKIAKEKNVEIKVYKNRIVKKAIEDSNLKSFAETLVGPNMFVFSYNDYVSAPKILFDFAKKNNKVELISGIVNGEFANREQILEIATLPTYEEALTMLATSLQAPIRQLGVGLKMLVDENKIKAE